MLEKRDVNSDLQNSAQGVVCFTMNSLISYLNTKGSGWFQTRLHLLVIGVTGLVLKQIVSYRYLVSMIYLKSVCNKFINQINKILLRSFNKRRRQLQYHTPEQITTLTKNYINLFLQLENEKAPFKLSIHFHFHRYQVKQRYNPTCS